MTLKTVKGVLTEFDLRSCESIENLSVRAQMHLVFLTGMAVGFAYSHRAIAEAVIDSESIDMGKLNRDMRNYAQQVIDAQSELNL